MCNSKINVGGHIVTDIRCLNSENVNWIELGQMVITGTRFAVLTCKEINEQLQKSALQERNGGYGIVTWEGE